MQDRRYPRYTRREMQQVETALRNRVRYTLSQLREAKTRDSGIFWARESAAAIAAYRKSWSYPSSRAHVNDAADHFGTLLSEMILDQHLPTSGDGSV